MNNLSFREKRQKALLNRRSTIKGDGGPSYNLTIPASVQAYLDANNLAGRWFNDDERGRIYNKTERDTWDFLTNSELGEDARNANPGQERVSRRVGVRADGSPLLSYLCVKPKSWVDEDARKRRRPHDEMMASIRNRPLKTLQGSDLSDDKEHAYIPKEVISRAKGIKRATDYKDED